MDRNRRDEQRQIVLADAEIEVAQRALEVGTVGDLVRDDAEFRADRVPHFARHHGDRDRHRMACAQAAHDHVEGVGKLRSELLQPAPAQDPQAEVGQDDPAEQGDQQSFERVAAEDQPDDERHDRHGHDDHRQLLDADRQA